jgi:hypothetical protein
MLGLLAVGSLRADMLNLPAQTGTFSSNVRGYWFTAPVAFQITGVGVPTDASSGTQTIEILRLNAPPPQYSSTTNDFTSLFRVVGDSSLGLIPVSIAVGAGDVIGVLGYRGSVNSYGPQSTADIFGNSITLARFGMQFNLNSVPAQDVWTEAGGNISRVNLEYGPAISGVPEPSTWMTLGLGVLSFGALKLRRRSS